MREQVISQRVGERAGAYGKRSGSISQRPSKRGGDFDAGLIGRLRALAGYLPLIGKIAIVVIAAGLIFAGYRAAASASFFQIRQVDVRGTSRASADQIQQVVHRTVGQSGVWRADLAAVSTQLEHLPWVRTAVVSRLLPDGLRVRITERVPRAVVRNAAGHFVWVDEDAVVLGELSPSDQMPAFFLRGWNEEAAAPARNENRERVEKYLELTKDWTVAGLAERVSEVNLLDLVDVRAQLAGEDSQIEVRLGAKDHGIRLKKALDVLDELKHTPRGAGITCVDISQGRRAIVRFTSGVQVAGDQDESKSVASAQETPAGPANPEATGPVENITKNDSRGKQISPKAEARNRDRTRGH